MEIDGYELIKKIKEQAEKLEIKIITEEVKKIKKNNHCFNINNKYQAHTIILATGAEARRLGLNREKELTGKGVHYCVLCDGPLYRDKTIAMIGGGDASVKGINLAAEYVKKIYFIVREKEITAEPINLEQMRKLGNKIKIMLETEVKELIGQEKLEKIILNNGKELDLDGLFIEIGYQPQTKLAESLGVKLDKQGYIKVDNMMKTNIDGVFACGDVVNHFGSFKQDITAAAMGAVAATSAYQDKKIHGDFCPYHAVIHRTKPKN